MAEPDLSLWEPRFERFVARGRADAAHGLCHVRRVVESSRRLAAREGARLEVVVPAAWLHDCVAVPKDDPRRAKASVLAAGRAADFLRDSGYPGEEIPEIEHAIEAHSFSAAVAARTPEAKVVQDADRLDALGAIGIARTMMLGGAMEQELYEPGEPFPRDRTPDDSEYVLDHFHAKLLGLERDMKTTAGLEEARRRTSFVREYLRQLGHEIGHEFEDSPRGSQPGRMI